MWTQDEWAQRRLVKPWFAKKLEEAGYKIHGWANRMPQVSRLDGFPVDWEDVEKIALGVWEDGQPEALKPKDPTPVVEVKEVKSVQKEPDPEPLPEAKPETIEEIKDPPKKKKRGRPKKKKAKKDEE